MIDLERRLNLLERQVDVQAVTIQAKADSINLVELAKHYEILAAKQEFLRGRLRLLIYHLAYIASLVSALFAGVLRFGLFDRFAALVGN